MHTTIKSKIEEFIELADTAYSLYETMVANPALASTVYDLVFSPNISRKIFDNHGLDYYDPDTSYFEDVQAFAVAAKSKADEYRRLLEDVSNENKPQ